MDSEVKLTRSRAARSEDASVLHYFSFCFNIHRQICLSLRDETHAKFGVGGSD